MDYTSKIQDCAPCGTPYTRLSLPQRYSRDTGQRHVASFMAGMHEYLCGFMMTYMYTWKAAQMHLPPRTARAAAAGECALL